jgi:hypothetical protein
MYMVLGYECKRCKERKLKEINAICCKPHMLDAAVAWRSDRPERANVLQLVKTKV